MADIKGRKEPAYSVIIRFGGVTNTAKICKLQPSAVSRWLINRAKGGTNGTIPQVHWPRLLAHASKVGVKLTVQELSGLNS
mgnify:CR=1 FL=1